jgi:hypothetical protein
MFKKSATLAILSIAALLVLSLGFSYERFSGNANESLQRFPISDRGPLKVDPPTVDPEEPCINLETGITPDIVTWGDEVELSMMVENCSEDALKVEINYTVSTDSLVILMAKTTLLLASQGIIDINHTRLVPDGAPAGEYDILVEAMVNGSVITSGTANITIY